VVVVGAVVGGRLPALLLESAFSAGARASSIIAVVVVERASEPESRPVKHKRRRFQVQFLGLNNLSWKGGGCRCPPTVGPEAGDTGVRVRREKKC